MGRSHSGPPFTRGCFAGERWPGEKRGREQVGVNRLPKVECIKTEVVFTVFVYCFVVRGGEHTTDHSSAGSVLQVRTKGRGQVRVNRLP